MAVIGNNPGNIRFNDKDKWQGLAEPPKIGAFCSFTTPVFGIRAIARVLIAMQDKHNCRTIRDFISRYAPPADLNPTEQYIANVSTWTGLDPLIDLDIHTYEHCAPLVAAIIRQEQGSKPYSQGQIDDGLKLAGIVPSAPKSAISAIAHDPKVIATTIAGTAGAVQGAVSSVSDLWDTLGHTFDPRYLIWGCVVVIICVGIYYAAQKKIAHCQGRI